MGAKAKRRRLAAELRGGGSGAFGWSVGDGFPAGLDGSPGRRNAIEPRLAETVGAVLACVELASSAIGTLPASLVIDGDSGREPAPASTPGWRVLQRPNPWQSWPAFAAWSAAEILLHGNSVAMIATDGRGAPSGLVPAPWQWLRPVVIEVGAERRLAYEMVAANFPEVQLLGLPSRLLDTEVCHVRARSDHGLIGRSVLSRAAGPVHEGREIQTLAQANWKNGVRPSGYLSVPTYLNDTQRERYGTAFVEKYTGAINAGKIPLLEGGWKFEALSMNSVDMEFLQSRVFNVSDICRLFCIPEPLLQIGQRLPQDLQPYTVAFASQCLSPLVGLIEAEFDNAVLPAGVHLRIDMSGLMRGSYSTVAAAQSSLKQSGIISANDARAVLGLPATPDGDALASGPAPSWPADRPGMPHTGPSPGPTGPGGIPNVDSNENEGNG